MLSEHSLAVLCRDLPKHRLAVGDVGTVVHVYREGAGYELEFVDGAGQTYAQVTVEAEIVRPVRSGELLHTRTAG